MLGSGASGEVRGGPSIGGSDILIANWRCECRFRRRVPCRANPFPVVAWVRLRRIDAEFCMCSSRKNEEEKAIKRKSESQRRVTIHQNKTSVMVNCRFTSPCQSKASRHASPLLSLRNMRTRICTRKRLSCIEQIAYKYKRPIFQSNTSTGSA